MRISDISQENTFGISFCGVAKKFVQLCFVEIWRDYIGYDVDLSFNPPMNHDVHQATRPGDGNKTTCVTATEVKRNFEVTFNFITTRNPTTLRNYVSPSIPDPSRIASISITANDICYISIIELYYNLI